jgi:hypothetical protein
MLMSGALESAWAQVEPEVLAEPDTGDYLEPAPEPHSELEPGADRED